MKTQLKCKRMLMGGLLIFSSTGFAQSFDIFTEDISAFNSVVDTGSPPADGAIVAAPTNTCGFGSGLALRMYDFNFSDKPELQGELVSAIQGPFQVSFQSCNHSTSTNPFPSIHWRMANPGKSVTAAGRSAFTLSWHADLHFSASYESAANTTEFVSTPPQAPGVHDIMLVGNHYTNQTYSYTLFSQSRTLDPLCYDVFIDGVLLNSDPQFSTGMKFSAVAASDYDPALGLRRFGLLGSSASDAGPDVWFDNIVLNIGALPVPAEFTGATFGTFNGFSFNSVSGTVYALQYSTNATTAFPVWGNAGLEVIGDGGTRILFDPAGFNTNKTYRIIEIP